MHACMQPFLTATAVFVVVVVSGGALANMWRVCENAMKQYRRTRPDPSRNAIHRAKELNLEHVHPLLLGTSPDTQGRWVGREGGRAAEQRKAAAAGARPRAP